MANDGSEPRCLSKRRGAHTGALIGVAISAVLLFFLFRGIDWAALGQALKQVNYLHMVTFTLSYVLVTWARAFRWKLLLPEESAPDSTTLAAATWIGSLATFTLPLRAGEFVRPWALTRWSQVPFSTGFATIITERVFDVLTLLALLGFSLARVPELPQLALVGAQALGVLALGISALMVVAYLRSALMIRIVYRIVSALIDNKALLERLMRMFEQFLSGIKAIRSLKELFLIILWSFVLWLNMAAYFQVGLWAMGIYPSMIVGLLVTVMVALAVAAPSAPGFLGTFQVGCVAALTTVFGYTRETAVAYSIVVHASQMFIIVFGGLVILYLKGLGFSELRRSMPEDG